MLKKNSIETKGPYIYIIDDDRGVSDSLVWMLESIGFQTKTFYRAQDFLDTYHPNQYGCILLDISMPGMSGPELQIALNERGSKIPIIFISGDADIPLAVKIMSEGAIDFLLKPFNEQILLENINKALEISKKSHEVLLHNTRVKERFASLSQREEQVMMGIIEGKQNKDISQKLKISLKTVEAHRGSLMRKMGVKSVSELVKIALENGMVPD